LTDLVATELLMLEKCVAFRTGDCLHSGRSGIYTESGLLHSKCLSYTRK